MNLRFLDWIWTIRGSMPAPDGQSGEDVFTRLDPLFHEYGTTYRRTGDTLTFSKKDQPAQDKMSVFDAGVLQVEPAGTGAILRYRLSSRALLFCFLAPLMFLAFGQALVAIGKYQTSTAAAEKAKAAEKKPEKKDEVKKLHPVDVFLGAPAPEKPKKDPKDKAEDKKYSPTSSYVFAGLFAALYVIGRILEAWLVKRVFRKRLTEA